jgi:hypothetical protein
VNAIQAPAAPAAGQDPAVSAFAAQRGITELLHFTTHKGALGVFATGSIMSRDAADTSEYIKHIYTPNCNSRWKDRE